MLPETWTQYVFPAELRTDLRWLNEFCKNRRTYVLGFHGAALAVGRHDIESIREGLNPRFKEDPRRYIPLDGWRKPFKHHDEKFKVDEYYTVPPKEQARLDSTRWAQFGKDQPQHAWLKRTMRLYDALKCVAALHDAEEQADLGNVISASLDGVEHGRGQLSLHIAIFSLARLTREYYQEHFAENPDLLVELHEACGLRWRFEGEEVPTIFEMAEGLAATERTCSGIQAFCAQRGLPPVGPIEIDLTKRGTKIHARQPAKAARPGALAAYTEDCAIEVFRK